MDEAALPWVSANGRIGIGWGEVWDIRQLGTFDAIAEAIQVRNANHPLHTGKREVNVQHGSHSLHDFCYAMRPGDLVIVSDRRRRRGVWEVEGQDEYAEPAAAPLNYQHQQRARRIERDADAVWLQAGGAWRTAKSTTALSAGAPTKSSNPVGAMAPSLPARCSANRWSRYCRGPSFWLAEPHPKPAPHCTNVWGFQTLDHLP
jgi:hypothetical protein